MGVSERRTPPRLAVPAVASSRVLRRGLHGLALVAIAIALAAGSVAGAVLALRAFGETTAHLAVATVSVDVTASRDGRAELFVPLVDWRATVRPYHAPVHISVEVQSVNRTRAIGVLRSPTTAGVELDRTRQEVPDVIRAAVDRAFVVAVIGGLLGGAVVASVLALIAGRRRIAVVALPVGLITVGAMALPIAYQLDHYDPKALQNPTFQAHGSELPRLLELSSQLGTASRQYTDSFDMALKSLAALSGAVADPVPVDPAAHDFMVASDIHSNTLPLAAFRQYASGKPIFLVGDFTQLGTDLESSVADDVAHLGRTVVAVSGNHDSLPLMQRLAAEGVLVLRTNGVLQGNGKVRPGPVVTVDGMTVAGFTDPLEVPTSSFGYHPLELQGAAFTAAGDRLVAWFDALEPRPRIVLVHQHGLAHALLSHVAAQTTEPPVVILTGHDHVQHIERLGRDLLVDGGTLGAGGIFAVGQTPAGFIELRLDASFAPTSADMVQIQPVTGDGAARRVVFDPADTSAKRWQAGPPPTP
jgi:predicted phosphodiesterase